MKDIAIIIVNWNGKKYLKDCLDSLSGQSYENFKVFFVDNGSEDDSVEFVSENWADVEIIHLEKNTGFAYANNVGIKKAFENNEIRFVITLNNDTVLDREYLKEMIVCAKKNNNIGSVQPKVLKFYEKEKIDNVGLLINQSGVACNKGAGEKDEEKYEKEEEIFGSNATASLYSREALEKVSIKEGEYFDSDFFAYYEDVDLAWRLRLAGYACVFNPKSIVYHVHSATGNRNVGMKRFYIHRNSYYVIFKNLPLRFLIVALLMAPYRYFLIFKEIFSRKKSGKDAVNNESKSKSVSPIGIFLKSWLSLVQNFRSIMKKRRQIQKNRIASNAQIEKWFEEFGVELSKSIK